MVSLLKKLSVITFFPHNNECNQVKNRKYKCGFLEPLSENLWELMRE
ncbi:hypothetical protein LINGRAHAP2_LOCUS4087, partial [Linum grandiflorum]